MLPKRGWHLPRHHHPFHELIVVLDGAMEVRTDDGVVQAEAGDVLFYRAMCPHEETADNARPVSTFFIAFQADAAAVDGFPWRLRDADARVRQMVAWLVRDHVAGVAPEEARALLRAVVRELQRLCASPPDPWLGALRDYMQHNLARPVYLADLARRAGMSKFAFVRKFKRVSGRTPMRELQLLRVNQARAMMLASALPVKAIAAAVGLNDEYQLSKLFRRHLRLSPREMRARSQAKPAAVREAE
ncbi:AraC family transcriptional regulator [Horticoccus luteus]|uniref:AraC family transcriptional regulator n=1 Tax=Horticoccus luteus TaxID=2862869 RepID=A0A8F9TUL9_9BACT|nr:AraC family transcriptional regulator [Horticoccus luteus]QYM78387.1 AraC family transcriptional regulator [Horticoccus luteus]